MGRGWHTAVVIAVSDRTAKRNYSPFPAPSWAYVTGFPSDFSRFFESLYVHPISMNCMPAFLIVSDSFILCIDAQCYMTVRSYSENHIEKTLFLSENRCIMLIRWGSGAVFENQKQSWMLCERRISADPISWIYFQSSDVMYIGMYRIFPSIFMFLE